MKRDFELVREQILEHQVSLHLLLLRAKLLQLSNSRLVQLCFDIESGGAKPIWPSRNLAGLDSIRQLKKVLQVLIFGHQAVGPKHGSSLDNSVSGFSRCD